MTSNIFGNRLKMLRTQKGLTQEEFAIQFSDFIGRKKPYSLMAISHWEKGRKKPRHSYIEAIADFFGVSVSVFFDNSRIPSDNNEVSPLNTNQIDTGRIDFYHNNPLYCVFKDKSHKDEWGLCNSKDQYIYFLDREPISFETLRIKKDNIELYAIQPYGSVEKERRREKTLTISKIKKAEKVWVQMNSFDDFVRGRYNGWYYNNRSKTCLININGEVLPYEGNGYSYNAYLEEFDG